MDFFWVFALVWGEKRKTRVGSLCPIRRLIAAGLIGDDIFVFSAGKFIEFLICRRTTRGDEVMFVVPLKAACVKSIKGRGEGGRGRRGRTPPPVLMLPD